MGRGIATEIQDSSQVMPGSTCGRDWDVRSTRWVMRTRVDKDKSSSPGKPETDLNTRNVAKIKEASWLATRSSDPVASGRLAHALSHVRCSMNPHICENATENFRRALVGTASRLHTAGSTSGASTDTVANVTGITVDGSNTYLFHYKSLQISITEGPNGFPEMSISFPGAADQAETADGELEEFVSALENLGTVETDTDGRRSLRLSGYDTIGLPVEHCFSQGVRFKILGEGTNRRALLDGEAVKALQEAMEGGDTEAASGTGVTIRSKCQTFQMKTGGSELDFQGAREAALTSPELEFVIDLLGRKTEYLGGVGCADPMDSETLRRQISELEAQLEEMERLRGELSQAQGQNADLARAKEEAERQLSTARSAQSRLETENDDLKGTNTALASRLEKQLAENGKLRKDLAEVSFALKKLQTENAEQARQLSEQRTKNESQLAALQTENAEQASRLEKQIKGLRTANKTLQQREGIVQKQNATLQSQLDAQRTRLSELGETNATLQNQLQTATSTQAAAERQLSTARSAQSRLQNDLSQVRAQLEAAATQLSSLQTENGELRSAQEAAATQLQAARDANGKLKGTNADQARQIKEQTAQNATLQNQLQTATRERESLRGDLGTARSTQAAAERQLSEARDANTAQASQIEEQTAQNTALRSKNTDLERQISGLKEQNERLSSQLSQLHDANGNLQMQLDGANADLERMRKTVQLSPIPEVKPGVRARPRNLDLGEINRELGNMR